MTTGAPLATPTHLPVPPAQNQPVITVVHLLIHTAHPVIHPIVIQHPLTHTALQLTQQPVITVHHLTALTQPLPIQHLHTPAAHLCILPIAAVRTLFLLPGLINLKPSIISNEKNIRRPVDFIRYWLTNWCNERKRSR